MTIILDLDFYDTVYLITDSEHLARQVLEVKLKPDGCVMFGLGCGETSSWHYRGEIATENETAKFLNNELD